MTAVSCKLRERHITKLAEGPEFLDEYKTNSQLIIQGINADACRDELWAALLESCRQIGKLMENQEDAKAFCQS